MGKLHDISDRYDSIYVEFKQAFNLGYFQGPSNLGYLADLIADDKTKEGYCYGLCVFAVECKFSPDIFLEDYVKPISRGKIRGYQKIQQVTNSREESVKMIKHLLFGHYSFIDYINYPDCENGIRYLNNLYNRVVFISLVDFKFSLHMVCCRIGGGKGPKGSIFFDPNSGFVVTPNTSTMVNIILDFLNEGYGNQFTTCSLGIFEASQ